MRVSLNWLFELVELPKTTSAAQIAERLTACGLEVEAIDDLAAPLSQIVVAKVLEVATHPESDKLHICRVDAGQNAGAEPLTIVCGAANVAAGVFVCLAPVGARMPPSGTAKGITIQVATLRGVQSHGMLCSAQELGLGFNTDGLLLLEPGADGVVPGAPVARALGRDDTVLTLGVTPNRPDALSHVGVARELAASMKVRLRVPTPTCAERGGPIDDLAHVMIEDVEGCPRYAARVIEGVLVAPSPMWVVAKLAACGVRSVNNVVDVTNLVMMERGIPLHAFDLDKVAKQKREKGAGRTAVIVRSAKDGEKLVTLDGKERELKATDLLIADPEKPIALAGVMGGADTEVTADTTRVLLECAHFNPSRVRATARRLGLHSEASHRFERGTDPQALAHSLDRAGSLIAEFSLTARLTERPGTGANNINGGRVARGIIDVYPKKMAPVVVSLRPKRAAQILGMNPKVLDEATISKHLLSLGLEVDGRDAEALRFRVPSWRPDLTREIDLVEELLRLTGTDAIPATLPPRASDTQGLYDTRRARVLEHARVSLSAAGFDEAINLAFVSPSDLDPFDGGDSWGRIRLKNPLGEEMSILRKSLLPGLLANLGTNHRRGNFDVRLYETGTVFLGKNPGGRTPTKEKEGAAGSDAWAREVVRLAGAAAGGNGHDAFDRKQEAFDFFDMKGVLEELLLRLGIRAGLAGSAVSFVPADDRYPFLHPRARAEVWVRHARDDGDDVNAWIGVLGEIHPDLIAKYEIKGRAVGFELDVEALSRVAGERPRAHPLPRFPAVTRDFAFVLDDSMSAAELCQSLASHESMRDLVENVDVFDVYRGANLPQGKRSIAVALTLRSPDRTLTDDEISQRTGALLADMKSRLGVDVRA